MAKKRNILLPAIGIVVLCVLLYAAAALGYYFLFSKPAMRPIVLIREPRAGERVVVGQDTTIHSIARDEGKVTRVELWVDGQLQQSHNSTLPGGISPFPMMVAWRPLAPGAHTLTVRAFNAQGGRGYTSINVEAITRADRDNDRVPDATDACPDQPGPERMNGCPDRDGDGIADSTDACPDQPGVPAGNGCPVASAQDRDGDGVLDAADACPDQPGSPRTEGCPDTDGDGVRDADDACPRDPGLPENRGCPTPGDRDGDGVADASDACPGEPGVPALAGCPDDDGDGVRNSDDACPDEPGLPGLAGCPDRDGDGVRDSQDLCPNVPGPASNSGCPVSGAGDRDGDGIRDDVDLCPNEPGVPPTGCPPPGGGADRNGDGHSDDEEASTGSGLPVPAGEGGGWETSVTLEFDALEFEVSEDFPPGTQISCYALLGDEPAERIGPFDPLGERRWDIAEYAGGTNSRTIRHALESPLDIHVECSAHRPMLGPLDSVNLGYITKQYPRSDWDGHVIREASAGAERTSLFFQVKYRICYPSCEEAALPAPMLSLFSVGGRRQFVWIWGGDRAILRGFMLYVNGNWQGFVPPDVYSFYADAYQPPCGERYTFQLSAFGNTGESRLSNRTYWTREPCPRTVRITFDRIRTGSNWGAQELEEGGGGVVGPIYGGFWASGSGSEQALAFDAATADWTYPPEAIGRTLVRNDDVSVQELFDWIRREQLSCLNCETGYSGPDVNYVIVELGPHDDLTFGGRIVDYDVLTPNEWLFDATRTIPSAEIQALRAGVPTTYTLSNRNIELVVEIEIIP